MRIKQLTLLAICFFVFAAPLSGCKKKEYSRKPEVVELGEIRNFLESRQHIQRNSVLILRDSNGWSALDTRCTKEGCDLTVQENTLFCSCCGSHFDFNGQILRGPAIKPLPFYEMFFRDKSLYVEMGKQVAPDFRFTTTAIERAIAEFQKLSEQHPNVKAGIPEVLQGAGDGEKGDMFVESNEDAVVEEPVQ